MRLGSALAKSLVTVRCASCGRTRVEKAKCTGDAIQRLLDAGWHKCGSEWLCRSCYNPVPPYKVYDNDSD